MSEAPHPGGTYLIHGPALISFSGGRTSGFMLKHILDAHGGTLPADVHVAFANTGREMPETLDFVQECSERWRVRIIWVEFDPEAPNKTRFPSYEQASRNGEPFVAVIRKSKSGMLPNPLMRFCTTEMKIRRFKMLMHKVLGYARWASVIGLRADEMRRVDRQMRTNTLNKERWQTVMPLAGAGVTKQDVGAWWAAQPFDLRLPTVNGTTPLGNCDLCFLKSRSTIEGIMRDRPELAEWWVEREREADDRTVSVETRHASVRHFRKDRPGYAELLEAVQRQAIITFDPQEDSLDCACTD